MPKLASQFLFEMDIRLASPQILDATPLGDRRIVPITGGTFEGPRVKGVVLPGGGDWILQRSDRALLLDVRLTLQTDDEALIYVTYRGVRHGPREVIERLNRGEPVDPATYYFRITPYFQTGSETYGWLNRIVSVGIGERRAAAVRYTVYEVL
jgi:hypothetical protein